MSRIVKGAGILQAPHYPSQARQVGLGWEGDHMVILETYGGRTIRRCRESASACDADSGGDWMRRLGHVQTAEF